MGQIYSLYRVNGGPTQHPEIPRPVTVDVLETGFILASCILFVCFALTIPGYKGKSRLYFTLRVVLSLFIGSAILIGVLGQEWETSEIETVTPYKAFTNQEIHAKVGIKIGLGSVNITLKGTPEKQNLSSSSNHVVEETINYNERFTWAWRQGRFGYGPYAGRIAREFRSAQYRGLPLPILWVAEYFVLDGELIRWGRSFRTAGWFANEVLWTAFPLYVIANILTFMVLLYAGVMFSVTGICMLVSTVIWATIKWGTQPMIIPFEDGYLETHYGPHFWLVIAGGIVSTLYGLVIVVMDTYFQNEIYDFFGKDILADTEEFYPETKEIINEDETYGTRNKQTTVRRRKQTNKKLMRRRMTTHDLNAFMGAYGSYGNEGFVGGEEPISEKQNGVLHTAL